MNKYIKTIHSDFKTDILWLTGMIEICLYIAASFPGTSLFGSLPVQQMSLYLLLGQSALLIARLILNNDFQISIHATWYGVFTVICLLSIILSGGSITNGGFYSILICFVLIIVQDLYIKDIYSMKVIGWCYVIISSINAIILWRTNSLVLDEGERLGMGLENATNPNVLATYLMYSLIYALWLFSFEKNKKIHLLLLGMIALILYPLLLTGGRKFVLAPLLFITIVLMIKNKQRVNGGWVRALIIMAFVVAVLWRVITTMPSLYYSIGIRLEGLFNSITGKGDIDSSTHMRELLRNLALKGWLHSPVWGHGFDTFKYYSAQNGLPFTYSHSNITELLYSGGLLLFVAYYWFYVMIVYKCFDDFRLNVQIKAFCLSGIIAQLLFDYGGVSFNLYETQMFLFLIYCATTRLNESDNKDLESTDETILRYKYVR